MNHKIAVVFDPSCGDKLSELMKKFHVWVTRSENNDEVIKRYIEQLESDPMPHGITKFEGTELTPELLENIWDHHGEFAHDPPLSEMIFIGLELQESTIDLLEDFGFKINSHGNGEISESYKPNQ
jgi:hypothetical protein